MANKKIWFGMLVMVLAFGMTVVGCDDDTTNGGGSGGLSGTWRGNIGGIAATVTITSTGWSMSFPSNGYSDSGIYIMDGITATLIDTSPASGSGQVDIGTAVLLDSNTISITLFSNTIAPGTYTLYRQ